MASALGQCARPLPSLQTFNLSAQRKQVVASATTRQAIQRGRLSGSKLKIAVDVDEVLGLFLGSLCRYCHEEHDMPHVIEDFFVYEFAKIWQCEQETSNYIVHEFFKSKHFRDGIPAMPGAYDALQRLKASHELAIVTSRQFAIQSATMEWLDTNFPDTFSSVHFGNHFAKAGTSRKKSDICREIGAHVLIDDNPTLMHTNITVVRDWEGVEASLEKLPARLMDHL